MYKNFKNSPVVKMSISDNFVLRQFSQKDSINCFLDEINILTN